MSDAILLHAAAAAAIIRVAVLLGGVAVLLGGVAVLLGGATAAPEPLAAVRALAMHISPRVTHVTRRSPAVMPRICGRTSVPEMVEDSFAPRIMR